MCTFQVANLEFQRDGSSKIGRQSQTWLRHLNCRGCRACRVNLNLVWCTLDLRNSWGMESRLCACINDGKVRCSYSLSYFRQLQPLQNRTCPNACSCSSRMIRLQRPKRHFHVGMLPSSKPGSIILQVTRSSTNHNMVELTKHQQRHQT